ncbi:hypothetical protein V1512DRAFT_262914 [Lipomyces arxii]|uniref:uncharacterized protein n=1 Tax=Lipomyces arxii TaxID=56418 RepID=UPI0034CD07B2
MDKRELEEYKFQLAAVNESLESDPNNDSLLTLKSELTDLIALLAQALGATESQPSPSHRSSLPKQPAPSGFSIKNRVDSPKVASPAVSTDKENEQLSPNVLPSVAYPSPPPAEYTPPPPPPPDEFKPVPPPPSPQDSYKVGSTVLARWLSGDKQYHRAKITGITGSSAQPMYTVKFYDHPSADTVPLSCLRANHDLKRKAELHEMHRVPKSPAQQTSATKPKPPKEKKAVDVGKAKWQEFSSKGIKTSKFAKPKKLGESSMFRSPDDVTGRVGVINSGKPMTKDLKRSKHVYNADRGVFDASQR